jgi:phosphoribosylglycinamide formyltransferase
MEIQKIIQNQKLFSPLPRARISSIPTLQPFPTYQAEGLSPTDLVEQLNEVHGADYVLLAGYLRLIPAELCRAYENRMLNIHPALLPGFGGKGMHGHFVHEAVVASGARFTGATVHFVNEVGAGFGFWAHSCITKKNPFQSVKSTT